MSAPKPEVTEPEAAPATTTGFAFMSAKPTEAQSEPSIPDYGAPEAEVTTEVEATIPDYGASEAEPCIPSYDSAAEVEPALEEEAKQEEPTETEEAAVEE